MISVIHTTVQVASELYFLLKTSLFTLLNNIALYLLDNEKSNQGFFAMCIKFVNNKHTNSPTLTHPHN